MPGLQSLATSYADLESFFCGTLAVLKPDLQMLVQGLLSLSKLGPRESAPAIKHLVMLISSMSPTPGDLKKLRKASIFPIGPRSLNGEDHKNSLSEWIIIDRSKHNWPFHNPLAVLNVLDYSLAEVRACKAFFVSMNLENRYLSELAEEETSASDGVSEPDLTRLFRMKVYSLFR